MGRITEIRIPGNEYGDSIILDEYNGSYSLLSARAGKDNEFYPRWAFPQNKEREPMEKAVPVKVNLGDKRENAAKILRQLASALEGGSAPDNPADDSDIPW